MATARVQTKLRNSAFIQNVFAYRSQLSDETKNAIKAIAEEVREFARSLTPGTVLREGWSVVIKENPEGQFSVTVTNLDPRANIPLTSYVHGTYEAQTSNRGVAEMTLIDLIDKGGRGPYTIKPFKAPVLSWIDRDTGERRFAHLVLRTEENGGIMKGTGVVARSQLLAQRLIEEFRATATERQFRVRRRVRGRG